MKRLINTLLIAVAVLFLFGCAAKQLSLPQFNIKAFDKDIYLSKVDNFLIIFDASSSMKELCQGNQKLGIAKAVTERINRLIPEMKQNAGLLSVGNPASVSDKPVALLYGMKNYRSNPFAWNLDKIKETGGLTQISCALTKAAEALKNSSGQTAVIIISDGEADTASTIKAAQALKDQLGKAVCFYPVQVGKSAKGMELMQKIAYDIGKCGFYSDAEKLLSNDRKMVEFIKRVFLKKKPVPKPAPDRDKDSLPDAYDKCPDSPAYARVNAEGCWVLNDILFDNDQSELSASNRVMLNEIVYVLEKNPGLTISISGYTDNVGPFNYNVKLSKSRADAVKEYCVSKGIAENRLSSAGFGPDNPITSNSTEEGRTKNRRVELRAD